MLKLVILLSVFSIISSEKPGNCPPRIDRLNCSFARKITCQSDEFCFGTQKCCRNECGGAYCLLPLRFLAREGVKRSP